MPRFIIERTIPSAGQLTAADRQAIAAAIEHVVFDLPIAWQRIHRDFGRRLRGKCKLFGTLRLDSPRLRRCACQPADSPGSSSPLAERLVERTTFDPVRPF